MSIKDEITEDHKGKTPFEFKMDRFLAQEGEIAKDYADIAGNGDE